MALLGPLLDQACARLGMVSSSPALDAQLLLAETLGVGRAHVLAHRDRDLTGAEVARFTAWLDRRAAGEPMAYILGRRAFYDREFVVAPGVLIPRPETEHLVEAALRFIAGRPLTVVDIGTGSGTIALTVKGNAPQVTLHATDISPDALAIARQNATAQGVAVTFWQGDLLDPLITNGVRVDLLMANLPYIATDTLKTLDVRHYEPHLALDGGPDGLDDIRRLLAGAPQVCNPGALILLEIGADQGAAVCALAQQAFPDAQSVAVIPDYAGHDRVVRVQLA
jgi:release factor glutamine methyltransferase